MVLTSGSGESTGTILKSLASYISSPFGACRPVSAAWGLGTADQDRTETRWNLAIAFPWVLLLEELSPESQKTRLAILIADGAPISWWPGFFQAAVCRGLSR